MITFMETKEKTKEVERCLDPQLWHACAGGMVQIPPVDAKVFYFPQGHAEHASGPVDFRDSPRLPPFIACRVSAVKFLADLETDEVYSKIKLVPLSRSELDFEEDRNGGINGAEARDKPASFAKTLTQSDANNGGGFSVPRYCAETIFPRLDYNVDPPVQNILAKDVHGQTWKFRHIYRGTPRRHLLTTGWSTFVNHKKLVAGDSIVFLRAENGDLCVGIRRAKRGIAGGPESLSGWNPSGGYGGYSTHVRDEESKILGNANGLTSNGSSMIGNGKVRPESVIEAAMLAANGDPFEVVYYPRASTPEFCVRASSMRAAMQIRWCSGMRFKMAFETEDSSRISWFMGTISSVQVADPVHWPESPWRILRVTWDEPDLLQNVKRVSPWLVEGVTSVSPINIYPFSPPRKKPRLPNHLEFPFDVPLFPMPNAFATGNLNRPSNPFGCLPNHFPPAGMQGARHPSYDQSFLDLQSNTLHSPQFPAGYAPLNTTPSFMGVVPVATTVQKAVFGNGVSSFLTMAVSKKSRDSKPPQIMLFGQTILTEQQMSQSSSDTISPRPNGNSSSDGNGDKGANLSDESGPTLFNIETGHCKIFMESEDAGRPIDLSLFSSYEELSKKLADLFGIENSEMLNHVLYRDGSGAVKHIGDEPFSEFTKSARRVTILMESGSELEGEIRS